MSLSTGSRFMKTIVLLLVATFSLATVASCRKTVERTGSKPADFVVLNANVFTCDESNPGAQAVAVEDGRFIYVGSDKEAEDYVGEDTEVIDAGGRMMTPGFIDNHCHILWMGAMQALMTMELYECKTFDELKEVVVDYSQESLELPFVLALGFRYEYLPERLPTKELLDSIISDRPAILWSYGGQTGWLNTAALEMMLQKNPEAFERMGPQVDEETGEYTGLLMHFHAFNPLDFYSFEELGRGTELRMMDAMRESLELAVSVGVTTMDDLQIYEEFIPMLLEFRDAGGLDGVRVRGAYYVDPHDMDDPEAFKQKMQWWKDLGAGESDEHMTLGQSVKFYIDGVSGNYTAFMLEPYPDKPDDYGEPVWSQEQFDQVIEIVDGMGIQACTHSCGDAGIQRVIDSYERAMDINGTEDPRHRSEHCPLPTDEDIERMADLGIYAVMQPAHFAGGDSELYLGPELVQRMMPWKSMEEAGVEISFGSDWCAGPINPAYGLIVAATRVNFEGETDWGPDEAIPVENSIEHWTMGSAKALKMEDDIGSIEVGKYADFVLFNQDLREMDDWWYLLTEDVQLGSLDNLVDLTVVGGEIVYPDQSDEKLKNMWVI